MGLYTVVHIYPESTRYRPDERTVRAILAYFQIKVINIVSGEPKTPWWQRLKDQMFPTRLVRYSIEDDVFYEQKVLVDHAIDLWQKGGAYAVHFDLGGEGGLAKLNESVRDSIPVDISNRFVPWDSGMFIGPWKAHDYDTGERIASGAFKISKSSNGYPSNLQRYEKAFAEVPEVRRLLEELRGLTRLDWRVTAELT